MTTDAVMFSNQTQQRFMWWILSHIILMP